MHSTWFHSLVSLADMQATHKEAEKKNCQEIDTTPFSYTNDPEVVVAVGKWGGVHGG